MTVITFPQALAQAADNKHLLLGNGFSIALKPDIFTYGSLYENADFSSVPYASKIFEALETRDFEAVIRLLVDMAKALRVYRDVSPEVVEQITRDAAALKNILVTTIASRHPDRPYDITDEQYIHCRTFLHNFNRIYTLNYDILLYWALMHEDVDELNLKPDDGFRSPEDNHDAEYVSWQEHHSATVYYLHGALHLFDARQEIIKYTWSRTDVPIVDQIRIALDQEKYPMFVSEGHSDSKRDKILHNGYLHKALRSFCSITGSIFIFGHSLDSNDDHILKEIVKNTGITSIFVSLYGDSNSEENQNIQQKANLLASQRATRAPRKPLTVHFFDSGSAHVWG